MKADAEVRQALIRLQELSEERSALTHELVELVHAQRDRLEKLADDWEATAAKLSESSERGANLRRCAGELRLALNT